MKIILNDDLKRRIDSLLHQLALNQEASSLYNDYLTNYYDTIDKNMINDIMYDGTGEEEAFYRCMLNLLDIDEDSELLEIEDTCEMNRVKILDARDYQKNPYLRDIHPLCKDESHWSLTKNYYQPYEGFIYDEMRTGENYAEVTSLGFFKTRYSFPELLKDDEVFMLITPHEINTMREPIKKAHGRVLVVGLGLGYFSYMTSLKSDVTEVVTIENDRSVIDLYEECIKPQIRSSEKMKIVRADAFEYLEDEARRERFDFIFFDIYHSATDAIPLYFKAKQISKGFKDTDLSFWIERDIICLLRRYLLTLIDESLNGFCDADYIDAVSDEDRIINHLYEVTRSTTISTVSELIDFLSDENIKRLASCE